VSGPPYPRYAAGASPGSNFIGGFVVGISPVGDIPPFDPWVTIIAQYANSPVITAMILAFNAAMDQTENIDSLYDLIRNVDTAVGYGLDVWGRIVGVSRALSLPGSVSYLGFEEADSGWTGFGQGPLYSGPGGSGFVNYLLSDSDFRTLIYAKAAGNISSGAIPAVNQILLNLFPGRGKCYVQDNLNMSLTYVFEFALTVVEAAILGQSGVLPSACGVAVSIQQVIPS
jgi:hypothetical protein